MKKFVIVMISLLVLFLFLMLNYLLWDKENLLEQRNNDRITQDWLRGQNSTLQSTIEELKTELQDLEKEIGDKNRRIADLEQKLLMSSDREKNINKEIESRNEAINTYKAFMDDELKKITAQWFGEISKNNVEGSYNYISNNNLLWGKHYKKDEYIKAISQIEYLELREEITDGQDVGFRIINGQDDPYLIMAEIIVNSTLKSNNEESTIDLEDGVNTLEIGFVYDRDAADWVIMLVETIKTGKP